MIGPLAAALLTGSFVVEYVFAIPGMGRFFITAVTDRDYPLIMGVTLVYTAITGLHQPHRRFFYSYVDPRIRRTERTGDAMNRSSHTAQIHGTSAARSIVGLS